MSSFAMIEGGPTETGGVNTASSVATSISAPATANTKGAWKELVTATARDTAWVQVEARTQNAGAQLRDIGIGPAGSEIVLIPNLMSQAASNAADPEALWLLPLHIPAGTRIAARTQTTVASGSDFVTITLISGGAMQPSSPMSVQDYGANTATSRGTQVDPGASANTKGAWTQIAAATAFPHSWLMLSLACANAHNNLNNLGYLIDVGIGSAGAETVLWPNLFAYVCANGDQPRPQAICLPCSIPAGSRLAVRAQCTSTTAADRIFDVTLHGVG